MIFNPKAARAPRWREAVRGLLERARGYDWFETEGPGHGAQLACQAARAGADLIVVAGGDGTLHEVVNGLLGNALRPVILPLPLGTGNDFVRALGIPREPVAAAAALHCGRVRGIDVASVRGREYFVNAAGFGLDADVARRRLGQPPGRRYTPAVVWTLLAHDPAQYELRVEDGPEGRRTFRGRALSITIANGNSVGGGYRIAPNADPRDGLLDVCIFEAMVPVRAIAHLWSVRHGRHTRLRGFHTWRCRSATLLGENLSCHLDGEYRNLSEDGSVRVEVLPQAIRVLA